MSSVTTIIGRESELIDVASIERELAGMWRSASDREQGAVTRACRGNLVVLTEGDQVPDFVSEITVRHPARLLTVSRPAMGSDGEGAQGAPIQAYVSALCHMRPGGGLVCSERIALRVAEGAEARVASLVRGLIVGDLPVTLLGPVEALDRYAGAGLLDVADQVMVDSTGASPVIWKRLAAAIDSDDARLVDLAWHRLAGFREVVAYAIARSPMRKAINRLEAFDIAHAGRPTAALLVAAWLAQRLKWGRARPPRPVPAEPGATAAEWEPASAAEAGGSEPFQRLELPGRGRRVRLRIGELGPPDDLVLVLRTSDIELRIGLNESESVATVAFGAGRVRLRRAARRGPRQGPRGVTVGGIGGRRPRERIRVVIPTLAQCVVNALEHEGRCDRIAQPVLVRAREMAGVLARDASKRRSASSSREGQLESTADAESTPTDTSASEPASASESASEAESPSEPASESASASESPSESPSEPASEAESPSEPASESPSEHG